MFEAFECKTFGDYVKIYCRSDIDILSFVFEKFIEQSMKEHGVDPSQCYSSPGFFWEAMLRSTKVEMELLTDPEMFRFFESAIRGGISVVPGRCADANNYLLEDLDPSKPSSFIEDLDKNGLYCTVMHYPLPIRGFRWLGAEEVKELCYQLGRRESLPANKGALLCVDLEYPQSLQELHSAYPLLSEKVIVNGVPKLVPNLSDKFDNVLTYEMLLDCMKRGILLKRVSRVVGYEKEAFLLPFVKNCVEKWQRQTLRRTFTN